MNEINIIRFGYCFWFFITPLYFVENYTINNIVYYFAYTFLAGLPIFFIPESVLPNKHRPKLHLLGYYVTIVSTILILALLMNLDADNLQINRNSYRDAKTVAIANLPLLLFILSCIIFNTTKKGLLLIFILFGIVEYIAFYEGRRTAAILPVIIGFIFVTQNYSFPKLMLSLVILIPSVTYLLYLTTAKRIGLDSTQAVIDILIGRIANPGLMGLDILSHEGEHISVNSIELIVQKTLVNFGLLDKYTGIGNEFGVFYGYLHPSNTIVAINPGVVVESYLNFGFLGFIFMNIILIYTLITITYAKSIFRGSEIIVALLVVHGMQMEIGYTVALINRIVILYFILDFLLKILPVKKSTNNG